jgi:hypothetical protein
MLLGLKQELLHTLFINEKRFQLACDIVKLILCLMNVFTLESDFKNKKPI